MSVSVLILWITLPLCYYAVSCVAMLSSDIVSYVLQGLQERLMVLFPHDVLLLSVDNKRLNIRYEVA